jgi:quercetin dioxygenase-like cupin family protein
MKRIRARSATLPGRPEWFSGSVWLDEIVVAESPARLRSYIVHFAPGSRTAWHHHGDGQVIHVTEGVGRAQARGGPVLELRAGDSVVFAPGEVHWHGAAPDRFMTHLAMQEVDPGGEVEWGELVSDEEYGAAPQPDAPGS